MEAGQNRARLQRSFRYEISRFHVLGIKLLIKSEGGEVGQ